MSSQHKKRSSDSDRCANKKQAATSSGRTRDDQHVLGSRKSRFCAMDAYSRHKLLVNEYLLTHPGSGDHFGRNTSNDETELDVLRANHRFIWEDSDEDQDADADADAHADAHADGPYTDCKDKPGRLSWGQRLAKKYYERLYKEYCICDLSRYKENKIAMRWRSEKEVISGKGQFVCGNKHCDQADELTSWEVNFAYVENNQKKNALVKIRLCPPCSDRLNYKFQRKQVQPKASSSNATSFEDEIDQLLNEFIN